MLTTSLQLVIALVAGPIVSSFPLLIIGGRLVGTVLLCEHLSQLVALVVHSIFVGVVVPQMWEFSLYTLVLAKPWHDPVAVAQVVHKRSLLRTETSF